MFHSIKKEELADPVLDYLFTFFTDEPTFLASVARALPTNEERKDLVKELEGVKASLARAEKGIARLVDAIVSGADPALLVSKQTQLKAECEQYSTRASSIEEQLAGMPDPDILKQQAMAMRLQLLKKVKERDWRKLSHDDIQRFLIFLFGENPSKSGSGIIVFREKGNWRISFKGMVEFQHELNDGKPLWRSVKDEAGKHNKSIKRRMDEFVAATRQT